VFPDAGRGGGKLTLINTLYEIYGSKKGERSPPWGREKKKGSNLLFRKTGKREGGGGEESPPLTPIVGGESSVKKGEKKSPSMKKREKRVPSTWAPRGKLDDLPVLVSGGRDRCMQVTRFTCREGEEGSRIIRLIS